MALPTPFASPVVAEGIKKCLGIICIYLVDLDVVTPGTFPGVTRYFTNQVQVVAVLKEYAKGLLWAKDLVCLGASTGEMVLKPWVVLTDCSQAILLQVLL